MSEEAVVAHDAVEAAQGELGAGSDVRPNVFHAERIALLGGPCLREQLL
jgi:hypothetical protein